MTTAESPKVQRALVLQGGGALAAYEAGVFAELSRRLSEKDRKEGRTGNMFDIIAGTSGGAINAALIVDYVIRNKTWDGVADIPSKFWRDTASNIAIWPKNEFFTESWKYWEMARNQSNAFWKGIAESNAFKPFASLREQPLFLPAYFLWPDNFGPLASEEAARRYWAWYLYAFGQLGIPGVLTPTIHQPDYRFIWNLSNYLVRYGNSPLTETIKKYWNFDNRIRTTEGQPRLMFVSVDIRDGMTATFDSYLKGDGKLGTEYEHGLPDGNREKHIIQYDDGLGIEHLLASMSSASRYVPPSLEATTKTISAIDGKEISSKKEQRFFWDGFYLSNTPLREVLQAHRDYWSQRSKPGTKSKPKLSDIIDSKVPNLEVYIVNMFPTLDKSDYPKDPDAVTNRVNDVLYHDRTEFDEKVASIVSDYVDMAKSLVMIATDNAKDKGIVEQKITELMGGRTLSKSRDGKYRTFSHLLEGRFKIVDLQRIELATDDRNDISGKVFDFSSDTIEYLISQGTKDAANCDLA